MTVPVRTLAGLAVVGIGTLIGPLDSAVNIAFPNITGSFGLPLRMIQWVVVCYVLTYASLMLVFGRLGDLFGYKRIFLTGLLFSSVALLFCALAPAFGWLLFFRCLQGIGTALVLSCGPALATSLFPESNRARVLGAYTMMFAIGSALGPLVGGTLVEIFDWRAVFWFRVPIALLAFALLRTLPDAPKSGGRGPFDLVGAVLLAASLAAMLLALNFAARSEADLAETLALALVAVLGFAGFAWRERRFAQPLIRLEVFRNLDFTVLNLTNSVLNMVAFSVLLLVPYFLVRATDLPLSVAGAVLASGPLGTVLAAPLGGWLAGRTRPNRIAFLGALLVGGGIVAVGTWGEAPPIGLMIATLFLQGFGFGLFMVSYLDVVAGTLAPRDRGVAGSLAMVTRTIGVVTGATGLTLVFQGLERAASAAGATALAAFLSGFQDTFLMAGGLLLAFLLMTALRPKIWLG